MYVLLFFEKIAVPESSTSGKVAVLKSVSFEEERYWKSSFSEKIDILQKCLLRKRNSSVDINTLSKFVFLNSCCSEKLAALKNSLFSRSSWSVEVLHRISNYFERITVEKCSEKVAPTKKNCSKEIAAPKK